MNKATKDLLEFWEDQMKLSHKSSNYFFRKSPSHYHMMLLVMTAYKLKQNLSVEELKTKLFTSNLIFFLPVKLFMHQILHVIELIESKLEFEYLEWWLPLVLGEHPLFTK